MGISPLYLSLSQVNFRGLVLMFLYNSTFHMPYNGSQHVVHSSSIESQHNVLQDFKLYASPTSLVVEAFPLDLLWEILPQQAWWEYLPQQALWEILPQQIL